MTPVPDLKVDFHHETAATVSACFEYVDIYVLFGTLARAQQSVTDLLSFSGCNSASCLEKGTPSQEQITSLSFRVPQ